MENINKKKLQEEIEFYSNLLKGHISAKNEHVKSTSVNLSQNSSWNTPSHAFHGIKNSYQKLTFSGEKYSFSKLHNSGIGFENKRTVLYNNSRTAAFPSDKIFSQRPGLNSLPVPKCQNSVLCSKSKSIIAQSVTSDVPGKMSSDSQALLKEIESVTQMLKKTSETKSKLISTTAKSESCVQNKAVCDKNISKKYYNAFSKCNVLKNENTFSKNKNLTKMLPKNIISNANSSLSIIRKINGPCCIKINSNNKNKHFSSFIPPKALNINKYCYKKTDIKQVLNSKTTCTPLENMETTDKSTNNIQKTISGLHVREVTCRDFKTRIDSLSSRVPVSKSLTQDNPNLIINLDVTKELLNSEAKTSIKSTNITLKSSNVSKTNPLGNRYTRINTRHSVVLNKNSRLKNASAHLRNLSTNKRTKNKVNTKYKVINKTSTPCANNRTVNLLSNSGCKENSPLSVDESDPLFKFLHDSTVDKLEQDLLAISTTLTAPTLNVNDSKMLQYSSNKMNSKVSLKKTPLKKTKARVSKYKVVNSATSRSYALKKRNSFTPLKSSIKRVHYSKFRVVNKHLQPMSVVTPVRQGKSILVKRLFKSKNTIINKNASPTNYSAKLIKSKYITLLNKRRLPYQNHALYPKVPLSQQKFKGYYLPAKLHSKQNRYHKTGILASHPKLPRRFSHYNGNALSRQFNENTNGNKCKRKLNNVVFIRGVKYSRNSSGNTLRKLPAKGQTTKAHQKIVNSRACGRKPENKIKATTPLSSNLASRVLHRYITRVLPASSKKNLTKVNTYCMFYNRFGRCNRGIKCTYIHDPSKIAVCTRFLRGTCKVDRCPFSHEVTPGKMAICSFFLVGACEKDNCPYRHEKLSPNAQLCKAFVQGYCPYGKECKKAHILICPKYIQGECEKGSSCAFPHPPQKAKKNVPKEVDEEVKKPDDDMLEKVARYFQQGEDILPCQNKSDGNNAANLFVPKQRKLEEQPSFIPLFDNQVLLNNENNG